jgi:hypothetical protein
MCFVLGLTCLYLFRSQLPFCRPSVHPPIRYAASLFVLVHFGPNDPAAKGHGYDAQYGNKDSIFDFWIHSHKTN